MSSETTGPPAISLWDGSALRLVDWCDMTSTRVLAADSWRVDEGRTLGIELHRARLETTALHHGHAVPEGLWEQTLGLIPATGSWFPRIDLLASEAAPRWQVRMRPAPVREASAVLATAPTDPRTEPRFKGPDLAALLSLRTSVQARGATEAILLDPEGHVVDGTTSAILWWDAEALCLPDDALERTDSVTARTIATLATALGVDVLHERRGPAELADHEVWVVNALHGIRIVTEWVDGPQTAQEPGRLRLWRQRLAALRRPIL